MRVGRFTGLVTEKNSTEQSNPGHLAGFMIQSRPRVWMRFRSVGHSSSSVPGLEEEAC